MNDTKAERLTFNGIHLTAYGYWAVAQLLTDQLGASFTPWSFEHDVNFAKGFAVAVKPDGPEPGLFVPPPPPGARVHEALARRLPRVVFKNLAPGTYSLRLNDQICARAGHDEWAKGVRLLTSFGQEAAEKQRQAIVDRNREFFYRWRAVNGEYIYGRR